MKTAKVIALGEVKEWEGQHGTVYYCQCEMDNGDKIEIGKKKAVQVGWDLTYEIVGDDQQEWRKAKSVNPPSGFSAKSSGDLKGVKIGHAITNAVSLVCAHGTGNMDMKQAIKNTAKMIYQISEELNNEI